MALDHFDAIWADNEAAFQFGECLLEWPVMDSSPASSEGATLRQYKSLLTVGSAVAPHLDLQGLLQAIGSSLREVVPHDAAILILRDDETGQLRLRAVDLQTLERLSFEAEGPISLDDTPEGHAITSGKPVLVGPTVDLTRFSSPWVQRAVKSGVRSGCVVPLISNGQAFGTLSVVSSREGAFTQGDVELLSLCGGQIATAVENALNFERAKRERDRFAMMSEASKAVSASLSFQELLRTTSAIVRKHIDHDFAGLSLYDEDSGNFRILALDKPPEFLEEGLLLPMEGTPDGLAYQTREPVWRAQLDVTEFPAPVVQQAYKAGMRSGCSVPLISRDRVIGVLAVASKREYSITPADVETLQLISNQIASSLENALNFERTRQAEREIRRRF
jgi:formate hydrogenlyase transcriptional activator